MCVILFCVDKVNKIIMILLSFILCKYIYYFKLRGRLMMVMMGRVCSISVTSSVKVLSGAECIQLYRLYLYLNMHTNGFAACHV